MVQQILLVIIFVSALAYIVRILYRSFQAKSNCAIGCGKCNAVDFSKIEEELKSKKQFIKR